VKQENEREADKEEEQHPMKIRGTMTVSQGHLKDIYGIIAKAVEREGSLTCYALSVSQEDQQYKFIESMKPFRQDNLS
jgi:hypothetical protein